MVNFYMKNLKLFFSVAILSTLFTSLLAINQKELSLKELCKKSDAIVLIRVLSTQSFLVEKEKRIFTNIEIEIKKAYKGTLLPTDKLKFTVIGGTIAETTTFILGAPSFRIDEESILFLSTVLLASNQKNYVVEGLSQGKFDVNIDPTSKMKVVTREKIETPLKLESDSSPIPLTDIVSISLNEFESLINQCLK